MDTMNNRKEIFNLLHKTIGMTPKVLRFYDEKQTSEIDIYIGVDRPDVGLVTYSTIGLSDYPIGLSTQDDKSIRVEFITIIKEESQFGANIIASCAFNIINDKYTCRPGIVYPNIITEYYKDCEMKHLFFTSPFEWPELEKTIKEDRIVLWLMAIPISDAEFEYLHNHGYDAFEELLESKDVCYYDLNRKSIL